jgi:hypothetical protein
MTLSDDERAKLRLAELLRLLRLSDHQPSGISVMRSVR